MPSRVGSIPTRPRTPPASGRAAAGRSRSCSTSSSAIRISARRRPRAPGASVSGSNTPASCSRAGGRAAATARTAETIARAVTAHEGEIVVSGGGAKNPALIERLAARVQPRPVVLFDQVFFDGEAKEAVAFAFLGLQTVSGRAGNLPAATGGGRGGGAGAPTPGGAARRARGNTPRR